MYDYNEYIINRIIHIYIELIIIVYRVYVSIATTTLSRIHSTFI